VGKKKHCYTPPTSCAALSPPGGIRGGPYGKEKTNKNQYGQGKTGFYLFTRLPVFVGFSLFLLVF